MNKYYEIKKNKLVELAKRLAQELAQDNKIDGYQIECLGDELRDIGKEIQYLEERGESND